MNKKIIALLIISVMIFLEIYFNIFSNMITGLATIVLSIASKSRACLEFLDMPTQVVQYSSSIIRVGLHNCGSERLDESTIRLDARDINNISRSITDEPVLNLSVDERRTVEVSWHTSLQPDEYTMYVWSIFDNDTSNIISSNFTVLPAPLVPPKPSISPGYEVIKIANISVVYPPKLNLTQDAEYIVLIKVINNGELDIHNLYLELESSEILTEVVFPEMQSVLELRKSVIFTTNLKVPKELRPGTYTIDWFVYSDEVDRSGKIIGEVRVLDIKEKAKELLLYYTDLLNDLKEEIDAAEREEKNVTVVRQLFYETAKDLEVSKELFRLTLYSASIEHLEVVRLKIVQFVRALIFAESIKKPLIFPALPMIPCMAWVIMLIIVNSIVALSLNRKLHWIKIVVIMSIISLFVVLLARTDCIPWVIFSTLTTILIFIFLVLIEKLKKERPYLLRFRRW